MPELVEEPVEVLGCMLGAVRLLAVELELAAELGVAEQAKRCEEVAAAGPNTQSTKRLLVGNPTQLDLALDVVEHELLGEFELRCVHNDPRVMRLTSCPSAAGRGSPTPRPA